MTRPIPTAALDFIKGHEGWRSRAYICPAGKWTIGWGHTGDDVHKGWVITKAKGEELLSADLAMAGALIRRRIGAVVDELTDNQYAALLSFVFNLGAAPTWTIWKVLKARAFDQVPVQLIRFVYATDPKTGKKVKLPGLVKRRTEEVQLWSTDEPGTSDVDLPSSSTREVETPPAPMEKPAATSKTMITSVATAGTAVVAAAGPAVEQVSKAIEPYADKNEWVGKVWATLAGLAAALAVLAVVFLWLKQRNGKN